MVRRVTFTLLCFLIAASAAGQLITNLPSLDAMAGTELLVVYKADCDASGSSPDVTTCKVTSDVLKAYYLTAGNITTTEILDGTIAEVDLKVVDSPVDEECFTYEATTGDFEWQSCSSGAGDVTDVGDCTGAGCFTADGLGTSLVFEGSTADGFETTLTVADPGADYTVTIQAATHTIVGLDTTDTLTNKTLTAANNVIEADTGDSATSFFSAGTIEHERGGLEADVSAYAGLVAVSGGSTSNVTDSSGLAGTISDETGSGVLAFATAPTFTTKLSLVPTASTELDFTGGTTNAVNIASDAGFVIDLDNNNDDTSTFQIRDGADTAVFILNENGTLQALAGYDAIGAVDMDYGSADVTDHTFITDGTGTAEIVLPAGSIDSTEILDSTVAAADMADADHGDVSWTSGVATVEAGTATTAAALAANPSDCAANNFATTIAANGDLTCAQPAEADISDLDHLTEAEARTGLIENGSAEMTGETLGTACAENQILKANATGGLDCAADADSGGAPAFSAITGATNTTAAMVVGTGASLGVSGSGAITATAAAADTIDAITEVAAALKTGADLTFITGTAGTSGHCGQWNADGDLVTTGAACGGAPATADISDVSVTQTELAELETIDATTISAAQWTGLGGATTAGIALWDDASAAAQLVTLGLTATAAEINTPLDGAAVTLTEFQELETIGATTVSAAQWTGLGGATTAGIALWDDANAVAQLVTLGLTATASEINTPLDGASVTLTEFQELETIGATVIAAADWTAVAAMDGGAPTLTGTNFTGIPSSGILTEVRSMYWPAGALSSDGTQCADPAEATINSGPKQYTIICTDNDASVMYGHVNMPDSWDAGNLTFELAYVQTAADTSALEWDIYAQCRGATETVNNTWETAVNVIDAAVTGSNAVDNTTSGNVTCASDAAGDQLFWKIEIDAAGTTTAMATLHIIGVKMEYTSNVGD